MPAAWSIWPTSCSRPECDACSATTRSSPRPTGASRWSTARCACWCCCTSSGSATRPSRSRSCSCCTRSAGIVANLGGGWLASRFGIPRMLAVGQILQIAGLIMLSLLDPGWSAAVSVVWVVIAQGISGIAKDVTKTASKSAIKATAAEGSGQLFRWVAWFTGSKNAMKGVGFFRRRPVARCRRISARALADGRADRRHPRRRTGARCRRNSARPSRRRPCASCSANRAASICWPRRASSCSARAMCGSWSACRCFSTPTAGASSKSAAFSRSGPSAMVAVQALRRHS